MIIKMMMSNFKEQTENKTVFPRLAFPPHRSVRVRTPPCRSDMFRSMG